MYCPPESGNIDPNSAKATQAHSEMTPPRIQTRKKRRGLGNGPAISFAVRKIEDPMMPLTSSSTESSRLNPRTSLGCSVSFSACGAINAGPEFIECFVSSHAEFVGGLQRRSAAAADDGRAVSAGQRISNFYGTDWAV